MGLWDDIVRNKQMRDSRQPIQPTPAPTPAASSGFMDAVSGGNGMLGFIPGYNQIKGMTDPLVASAAQEFGMTPPTQGAEQLRRGTMSNNTARSLGQPHLSPTIPEAGDYVDGSGYDKWADDFTADDIVDAVAPKAPGKAKTPKKQLKKRAAVKKAIAPAKQERYASVDPLNLFGNKNGVNPFASSNNPITNDRFSGGYVPNSKVKSDTADIMNLF